MIPDPIHEQVAALRRELGLIWEAHERQHQDHEKAHLREHELTQRAIDTAATLSAQNKVDSNEWRATMTDRERQFATKGDILAILARIDKLEDSEVSRAERERLRVASDAEDRRQDERRQAFRFQILAVVFGIPSVLGTVLGLLALVRAT